MICNRRGGSNFKAHKCWDFAPETILSTTFNRGACCRPRYITRTATDSCDGARVGVRESPRSRALRIPVNPHNIGLNIGLHIGPCLPLEVHVPQARPEWADGTALLLAQSTAVESSETIEEAIDETFEHDPRPPPGVLPLGVRRWLLPLPPLLLPIAGALAAAPAASAWASATIQGWCSAPTAPAAWSSSAVGTGEARKPRGRALRMLPRVRLPLASIPPLPPPSKLLSGSRGGVCCAC